MFTTVKTFDLELLDSNVTPELIYEAKTLFASWIGNGRISTLYPSQKLSKWRPQGNIALITNRYDFEQMARSAERSQDILFETVFLFDNILRLQRA